MGKPISKEAKAVGMKVATLRLDQGISQDEFAAQIGLSRNALGSIERGEAEMKVGTLISACNSLDATPNEMLPSRLSKESTDFPELNAIAEVLKDLSPYQRSQFFTSANYLLEGIKAGGK